MYVPMKTILDDANAKGYAVVAANVINLELVRGIIGAATELDSPIIVSIGQGQMSSHGDGVSISFMVREFASRTHVPVALHLDHGKAPRSFSFAFRHGFSSIMIDASEYGLDENIRRTREIVDLCHREGVTVEGELGHVGMADQNDAIKSDMYTRPQDARRFVEETGVDALAIAFGTAHGKYPKGFVPKLDFDRLKAIKDQLGMPLVMHGGSNTGYDNIARAVQCGINKLNVCTDTWVACRDTVGAAVRDDPDIDFVKLLQRMEKAAKDTIAEYIKVVGSAGKASAFKPFYDPYRTLWLGAAKSIE